MEKLKKKKVNNKNLIKYKQKITYIKLFNKNKI